MKSPVRKATKPPSPADPESSPASPKPALSLREAIALKRAEAKKAKASANTSSVDAFAEIDENFKPVQKQKGEDLLDLGRWSVRETIERSRSSGSINISTRGLQCLPSALYEVLLGVKPDPLPSLPEEPPLPGSNDGSIQKSGTAPAWYEAQDLQVLKAWSNEIVEIQHEISLFGSLQTVDLHNNKLTSLPDTFADLTELVYLDLSQNALTSLPTNLFALPKLVTLNVARNELTGLPFRSPFTPEFQAQARRKRSSDFFEPTISRAETPLPKLQTLDASHNKITVTAIDHKQGDIPTTLVKLDLSGNPLETSNATCVTLIRAVAQLPKLKELRLEKANVSDRSFPPDLFAGSSSVFPALRLLDCGESQATLDAAKAALSALPRELNFDYTSEDPPEGALRVLVGKKVIKEAWEIEAERRAKARRGRGMVDEEPDPWSGKTDSQKKEVAKEPWEVAAEQGLLTAGAQRRARATAALKAQITPSHPSSTVKPPTPVSPPAISLSNPQFYNEKTQTLALPASKPPSHARAFSLAIPSRAGVLDAVDTVQLALPTPSLPLAQIAMEPFAQALRVLHLANRRMDPVIRLPPTDGIFLPYLEELSLEGCGFGDSVPVIRADANAGSGLLTRTSESLLPLLAKLFPSLQDLDLSDNVLTSEALTKEALSSLVLSGPARKGLKHLRLRGNRLESLDGFTAIAEHFKGNRDFPEWKLEELDLRDNAISKLPPELGLLPLDVFLVDGNVFRVPQRRIWEREGTKGLLSWLRGRIE